jgi:hypothetical protein
LSITDANAGKNSRDKIISRPTSKMFINPTHFTNINKSFFYVVGKKIKKERKKDDEKCFRQSKTTRLG